MTIKKDASYFTKVTTEVRKKNAAERAIERQREEKLAAEAVAKTNFNDVFQAISTRIEESASFGRGKARMSLWDIPELTVIKKHAWDWVEAENLSVKIKDFFEPLGFRLEFEDPSHAYYSCTISWPSE